MFYYIIGKSLLLYPSILYIYYLPRIYLYFKVTSGQIHSNLSGICDYYQRYCYLPLVLINALETKDFLAQVQSMCSCNRNDR